MTSVYLERSGDRYTVHCQGHATGSKEVCAAVSCLVCTLANWLRMSHAEVLEERVKDADALLRFKGAETAFDMVCVGFLQLEHYYGEYIKVNTKNISFTG